MSNVLLIKDAHTMTSKSPMVQIQSAVVCTPDKFFVIPKKSTGMYLIFDTIKKHSFFDGASIEDGLERLLSENPNTNELQVKLTEILENNAKYIHDIHNYPKKSIKGFLGKKTLTVKDGRKWTSFTPKKKDDGKAVAAFYSF